MEGWITAYSGTGLTINVDLANGSGSYSDWNLNLSGAPGAGYAATSVSAASIITGPVTMTLQSQSSLAYSPGARVRMASQASPQNWVEGLCTAYSSLTDALTVNVDLIAGTGAFTAWNINLAGQQGVWPTDIDGGIF
jgi:hypothetical protein